jgi:hypothetical protein
MISENILGLLTPLKDLADIIEERGRLRGWSLKPGQIGQLKLEFESSSQNNPSSLTAIDIWAGHGMPYNVFEALDWFGQSVNRALKLNFKIDYDGLINGLTKAVLSEDRNRRLRPVSLDIHKLDGLDYILDSGTLGLHCTSLWFLALNPKVCLLADQYPIRIAIGDPVILDKIITVIEIRLIDDTVYINNTPITV